MEFQDPHLTMVKQNQQATFPFTHATTDAKLWVTAALVFGVYHSAATQATHICSTGGAMLPVKESVEEVLRTLNLR